jgi:uncharacterized protein DUF6653
MVVAQLVCWALRHNSFPRALCRTWRYSCWLAVAEKENDISILSKRAWKRHSNPLSVWTRIVSHPLVYVPFWNHSWKQGAAVAAWFAVNPVLFSEPEGDESWATRGVLGEELWTAKRPWDLSTVLTGASASFFAGGLWSAYRRRFWPTMFFASTAFLLKLWYIDRMVSYYEQHRNETRDETSVRLTSRNRANSPDILRAKRLRTEEALRGSATAGGPAPRIDL